MDSFEINKIIAAVLVIFIVIFGITKISDYIYYVEKPAQSAYKVEFAETDTKKSTSAQEVDGMAGIYGQAGIVPDRTVVSEILKGYLDVLLTLKGSGGGQKDGGLSLREGKIRDPNGVIV